MITREYVCDNCGAVFNEPNKRVTSYESYYSPGVFAGGNKRLVVLECPYCGSDEFAVISVGCAGNYDIGDDEENE